MYMLYKRKCSPILQRASQISRNTLAEVPSQCLQVERANTKSNTVYKKRELQRNEFTG